MATDKLADGGAGARLSEATQVDFGDMPWKATDPAQQWVGENKGAFSPEGQQVLQRLADTGKLDDPALRESIKGFVKDDSSRVITESILKQIDNPDQNIWQGNRDTCVAASAQKALATTDPAKYFQVAKDVITLGSAKLGDGAAELTTANREWIDANWQSLDVTTTTGKMDAMVQAALMNYANGDADYDIATDKSDGGRDGLQFEEGRRLNEGLLGMKTVCWGMLEGYKGDNALFDAVRDQVGAAQAAGKSGVGVVMKLDAGGDTSLHMMTVKGVDAEGKVTLVDANGQAKTLSREEFAQKVQLSAEGDVGGTETGMTQVAGSTTVAAPPRRSAPSTRTSGSTSSRSSSSSSSSARYNYSYVRYPAYLFPFSVLGHYRRPPAPAPR